MASLFKCTVEGCGKAFSKKCDLIKHVHGMHEGLRPFKCNVEGCERAFSQKSDLNKHVRGVHEGLRPFKCTVKGCEKAFSLKDSLNKHVRGVHEGLRPFKCTVEGCKKAFSQKSDLSKHVRGVHEGLRPFKCTVAGCEKAFPLKDSLNKHVRGVHEGLRPFKCTVEGCKKAFSQKSDLNKHVRGVHRNFQPSLVDEAASAHKKIVASSSSASKAGEWARATSDDGECYYYNLVTRESSWSLPAGAKLRYPTAPPRPALLELEDDASGDRSVPSSQTLSSGSTLRLSSGARFDRGQEQDKQQQQQQQLEQKKLHRQTALEQVSDPTSSISSAGGGLDSLKVTGRKRTMSDRPEVAQQQADERPTKDYKREAMERIPLGPKVNKLADLDPSAWKGANVWILWRLEPKRLIRAKVVHVDLADLNHVLVKNTGNDGIGWQSPSDLFLDQSRALA